MPDLKSELSKVINSWETPVATPTPTYAPSGHRTTTNSTRTTFNYVRDNPGMTRAEVIAGLAKVGVKLGSSSSLIATLVARGNLRLTSGGLLFATQKEYKPLPNPKTRVVKKKAAPVVEAPVETPKASEADRQFMDADTLLNHLSIKQARALYDELRKIFGA
jgi:hypothetical protein